MFYVAFSAIIFYVALLEIMFYNQNQTTMKTKIIKTTTTTNNATVIERTTETGTMQEIQTESKVTIPPLFFINISINF